MTTITLLESPRWRDKVFNAGGGGVWHVCRYKTAAAALALNDTIVALPSNSQGVMVADWFVAADQLDTNGAPTLTFGMGFLNTTGDGMEPALEFELGITDIGRAAAGSMRRAQTSAHLRSLGRGRRVGLHVSAAAATWGGAGKVLTIGLLLAPV